MKNQIRQFLLYTLLLISVKATSQQGVKALVIGISNYEQIQDLSFADQDAERFRSYLLMAFGEIDIRFYTNEQATYDQIQLGLDELLIDANQGDTIFFFFSGHGDCETSLQGEPGFLLSHDTPTTNYWHRALRLNELKQQLESYSTKQLSLILVVDACRAGKLVSAHEGGPGKTAVALMNLFQQQLVFVSCLPDEVSLELSKYKNGLFTYYLVQGLHGKADQNKDGELKMEELDRYVTDHVVAQSGAKQTPEAIGDPRRSIPMVPPIKQPQITVGSRGFHRPLNGVEDITYSLSTTVIPQDIPIGFAQLSPKEIEARFKKAIKEKRLLEPERNNAKYYYQIYPATTEADQKTHQKMRSKLLNALKKHPRDILLDYVFDEVTTVSQADQDQCLSLLEAGLSMLPSSHYLYRDFRIRWLFFKALQHKQKYHYSGLDALPYLEEALSLDSFAAFLHYEKGLVLFDNQRYTESRSCALQALEISPAWAKAYELLVQPTDHESSLTFTRRTPTSYSSDLRTIGVSQNTSSSPSSYRGTLYNRRHYKIQLAALRNYSKALKQSESTFRNIGTITTEFLPKQKLNRILLGDFKSLEDARESLKEVKQQGFTQAFICEYQQNIRIGRVN